MKGKFSNVVENAIRLANYWHQGQGLFGTEFDFFVHCVAVANILACYGFDEEVIAAGYCHDLLESTDCPEVEIEKACGNEVLTLVDTVTEEQLTQYWKKNKEVFIKQVKVGSEKAKAVAVAEQIHDLQVLIENLYSYGLVWFNKFYASPDDRLWFDDNLCTILMANWDHKILREYDQLIDQFADFLEKLNEENEYKRKPEGNYEDLMDFDVPILTKQKGGDESDKKEDLNMSFESHENFEKVNKEKKKERQRGKYLSNEEFIYLLPAALAIVIKNEQVTNQNLQDDLGISYLEAYKILKEMKRLHIVDRADSFKPRKVNITKAKELLTSIVNK